MSLDANFEEPLVDLRRQIQELENYPARPGVEKDIDRLRSRLRKETEEVYRGLSRWQKTLVARHFDRPFGDDPALVCGFATFRGVSVAVVGHQKGRDTRQRIRRNFGQPRPEGYRKALRLMHLAERFVLPVLSFVDT